MDKVHFVTETNVDHDDYPIGSSTTILVTDDEDWAREIRDGAPSPSYGRRVRSMRTHEVRQRSDGLE